MEDAGGGKDKGEREGRCAEEQALPASRVDKPTGSLQDLSLRINQQKCKANKCVITFKLVT